jgi:hypothetical protein
MRWFASDPEAAIERGEAPLRFSARGRIGLMYHLIGGALVTPRRLEEAIPKHPISSFLGFFGNGRFGA